MDKNVLLKSLQDKSYAGSSLIDSIDDYIASIVPEEFTELVSDLFVCSILKIKKETNQTFCFDYQSVIDVIRLLKLSYGQVNYLKQRIDKKEYEKFIKEDEFLDKISDDVCSNFKFIKQSDQDSETNFMEQIMPFVPSVNILKGVSILIKDFNKKYSTGNPELSLIEDLFQRVFHKLYAVSKMLSFSLSSDSYVAWRTLHESECILQLLTSNAPDILDTYRKHIVYNNALRGGITDEQELNKIFLVMKEEMKEHNLKSKDMKRFIEYGWIYKCKEFHEEDPNYKLNFRDGIERCANLTQYSEWYEAASELTHSSPIFFYANESFFFDLSSLALYETTLRLVDNYKKYFKERVEKDKNFCKKLETLIISCKVILSTEKKYFITKYGSSLFDSEFQDLFKQERAAESSK